MVTYSFKSEAKCDYFYPDPDSDGKYLRGDVEGADGEYFLLSDNGKTFFGYCGEAEKIVIPEGVTTLNQSWWLDTNLENVRCIILPDSLETLPDQFGVPFNTSLEVVVMGDNVTWAEGYHTFWRCFRLKHLRLSDNLENLPEEALFETISLTEVKLPSKLKIIGKGAFHLTAFRDITIPESVTEIAQEAFAWPLRKAQYLEEGVRTQGNAIATEITTEVDSYLQNRIFDSQGETIPRTLTILSKNAIYDELIQNYWNSDYSWSLVNVRYLPGSTTDTIIKGGYSPKAVTYSYLDMTQGEVEGRVASAVSTVPITKDTTVESLKDYIQKQLCSKNIKNITVSDYKYKAATAKKDGTAKATVSVQYGDNKIEVKLDRVLKYFSPYKIGDEAPENTDTGSSDKVTNDYLDVEFITDKEEYKSDEEIKVTLKLGNKMGIDLSNIKIVFDGDDLSLKKGSLTPVRYNLSAAEQKEANIVLVKTVSDDNVPSTDLSKNETQSESSETNDEAGKNDVNSYEEEDNSSKENVTSSNEEATTSDDESSSENKVTSSQVDNNSSNEGKAEKENNLWLIILIILICLVCIAAVVILYVRKIRHRRIISVILSFVMCISIFSFAMFPATATSERITVRKRITVDGERYTVSATISFSAPEELDNNMDNNYTVDWNINE